jgi:hypothetical protein
MGNNQTALKLIDADSVDQSEFQTGLVKAQILINLGRPQEAITVMDQTKKEGALQEW